MRVVKEGAPQGTGDFEAFLGDVTDYNSTDNYTLTDQAAGYPLNLPVPPKPEGRDYCHLPP